MIWSRLLPLLVPLGLVVASFSVGAVAGSRYELGKQTAAYSRQLEAIGRAAEEDRKRRIAENVTLQNQISETKASLEATSRRLRTALDSTRSCSTYSAEWVRAWNALAEPAVFAGDTSSIPREVPTAAPDRRRWWRRFRLGGE